MPIWLTWILKYAPEFIGLVVEWLKNHKTTTTTLSVEEHSELDVVIAKLEAAQKALA